jgi:hypothetical protein
MVSGRLRGLQVLLARASCCSRPPRRSRSSEWFYGNALQQCRARRGARSGGSSGHHRTVTRRMTKIVGRLKPLHAARSGQLPDLGFPGKQCAADRRRRVERANGVRSAARRPVADVPTKRLEEGCPTRRRERAADATAISPLVMGSPRPGRIGAGPAAPGLLTKDQHEPRLLQTVGRLSLSCSLRYSSLRKCGKRRRFRRFPRASKSDAEGIRPYQKRVRCMISREPGDMRMSRGSLIAGPGGPGPGVQR